MNILYFAWVRERVGVSEEQFDGDAKTVSDVLDALADRSEAHALALSDRAVIRVALDQELVEMSATVQDARELAIFPPMTGG